MLAVDPRRQPQETYDLREQLLGDDHLHLQAHADAAAAHYGDDEEHSMLEDDSEGEEREDYIEDDGSSSLSIPNESIDFDLVYSLHSFAATVEGQANVVKGDSLFLMDDSNSYWWLVRVLKTQEVGYLPAENIETPFERLARLNKHRNVDLASPTQAEQQEEVVVSQVTQSSNKIASGAESAASPPPGRGTRSRRTRAVSFTPALSVHRYPPAVWNEEIEEEEDIEWDDEGYEDEDPELADEQLQHRREEEESAMHMDPDDSLQWDSLSAESILQQPSHPVAQQILQSLEPDRARGQQDRVQQTQVQDQKEIVGHQQQPDASSDSGKPQQGELKALIRPQEVSIAGQDSTDIANPWPEDLAHVTETRKLTVTPNIARDQLLLPSANLEKENAQKELRKRTRDDEIAIETGKKTKGGAKMAPPVSSTTYAKPSGNKLRKEPAREVEEEGTIKKKKGSVFGGLFGRKKEKSKDKNASSGSLENGDHDNATRESEDSSRSGHRSTSSTGEAGPFSAVAGEMNRAVSFSGQAPPSTPDRLPPEVSQHANQLRQRDQHHQAVYQQYLNRSPSSPPEAQPSYGLQSASALLAASTAYHSSSFGGSGTGLGPPVSRPRPGSLILTSNSMDGQGQNVPDLSVIRVFAGKNLQTEATFKTVLLNNHTTSADLVKQAMQRFRLPAGEDANNYYLTVKQVEGGASAVLMATENPLVVFETLVVESMELPKVKRSSVGSLSSLASNLSAHSAIKKLPMNDFTDDSAVKFYLNRRGQNDSEDSLAHYDMDETLIAASTQSDYDVNSPKSQHLSVSSSNVTADRFTSPSYRFALQLIIYPEDLPEDMVFHPETEAIVFKDFLRESHPVIAPIVSPYFRRKVFMFPKNVTVAEVIELGLERFGISEGVVDGGDEVEDKVNKRWSTGRVRYGLNISIAMQEKELPPTGRIIDALPKPPVYRTLERSSSTSKRRSVDSALLLGSIEDVHANDPVFILRRAVSYRSTTSRKRLSAPLDEIALQHLHRDISTIAGADWSNPVDETRMKVPSRQEIIAAQRAATRANQRAILSAQTNSLRGVDVLLPGNAMLRSSRYSPNDRMRYSYVEPGGETYDVSDIIEQEWREGNAASKIDLLEGVLVRNKDGIGEKLSRVLNKIKSEKTKDRDRSPLATMDSRHSSRPSASEYSGKIGISEGGARSPTPGTSAMMTTVVNGGINQDAQSVAQSGSAMSEPSRSRATTPTGKPAHPTTTRRHPSIASVISDLSSAAQSSGSPHRTSTPRSQQRLPPIPKDDFGVSHLMAIIEYKALQPKVVHPPLDPVDEMLFGRSLDVEALHPSIRSIYSDGFRLLEEMDKALDAFLEQCLAHDNKTDK